MPVDLPVEQLALAACGARRGSRSPGRARSRAPRRRSGSPAPARRTSRRSRRRRVDLATAEARQLARGRRRGARRAARASASRRAPRPRGRADDVGEEHGREHPVRFLRRRAQRLVRKALQLGDKRLDVADGSHRIPAGKEDEAGRRDPLGHVARALEVRREPLAVDDERRHSDRGEDVAHVRLPRDSPERGGVAGARAEPEDAPELLALFLGERRGQATQVLVPAWWLGDALDLVLDPAVVLLRRRAATAGRASACMRPAGPRGRDRAGVPGKSPRTGSSGAPCRGCPKGRRSRPTASMTAPTSSICTSNGRQTARSVREPRAALVEADHPRDLGEPTRRRSTMAALPPELDVLETAGRPEQVDRPFADDLVGDVGVAAPRVPRLR